MRVGDSDTSVLKGTSDTNPRPGFAKKLGTQPTSPSSIASLEVSLSVLL